METVVLVDHRQRAVKKPFHEFFPPHSALHCHANRVIARHERQAMLEDTPSFADIVSVAEMMLMNYWVKHGFR